MRGTLLGHWPRSCTSLRRWTRSRTTCQEGCATTRRSQRGCSVESIRRSVPMKRGRHRSVRAPPISCPRPSSHLHRLHKPWTSLSSIAWTQACSTGWRPKSGGRFHPSPPTLHCSAPHSYTRRRRSRGRSRRGKWCACLVPRKSSTVSRPGRSKWSHRSGGNLGVVREVGSTDFVGQLRFAGTRDAERPEPESGTGGVSIRQCGDTSVLPGTDRSSAGRDRQGDPRDTSGHPR